jgi:hypothetical protein
MDIFLGLVEVLKVPVLWTAIILCAGCGVLGVLSPKLLATINGISTKWVDTNWLFSYMDKKIDVDRFMVKHARLFGLLSLVTAVGLFYRFF